ncbi:xanthine dehydrogenase family protein molybdopterin-binding subunit [Rhizobium leguminosarum]|uniref:xanthine dehydrogenase family protein molybdopterin-binding subunit n=1 Tax=Rhizobium leguminosarum TaxID=384 RepID=UPI001C947037|nr:xanthine dehydrogenase family protein molybdopterin-binding subunit [Rhizobium leguminosarum]MBY5827821.1 xanthine dehydrogenase family protein molybdopterin-binding subunit [Rhizobium leguminosarum]
MPMGPFSEIERVDAFDKVLGRTKYAADMQFDGLLHAMLMPATINRGRLVELDTAPALDVAGVTMVLTSDDIPTLQREIAFCGQPIAVVIAESLEAAIEGAESLQPRFETMPFNAVMEEETMTPVPAEGLDIGDAGALDAATTVVEGTFEVARQHHNAMETFHTIAIWSGNRVIVYEGCQNSARSRNALAESLGVSQELVTISSIQVGGGFGLKSPPKLQTDLVARAARLTGRPVKLVTPRGQLYHLGPHRPRSVHRMRLGADANGRMNAISYHAVHENIAGGQFSVAGYYEDISRVYTIPNFQATAADYIIDRNLTRQTRGTHPFPAGFALESLVDQMAHELGEDPVQYRLGQLTATDIIGRRPLAPHFLRECIEEGARRIGWEQRNPMVGSMRLDDGTLVGMGMACGYFGAGTAAAETTLRVSANGTTILLGSGHEMGQGMSSAYAAIVRMGLDINPNGLEIRMGDTSFGPQRGTVGEGGTSGGMPVVARAVEEMQRRFRELIGDRELRGNMHEQLARIRRPYIEVRVGEVAPGQDASALEAFRTGGRAPSEHPTHTSMSYIAQFVEIHIEPSTGRIRMPRAVSVADIGRVVSHRTARSQMLGGVVWGFSTALREETEVDPRFGGYLNDDLAEYMVAVNADIGEIDVALIDQPDPYVSSLGVKGMGELVMVGTGPAIANAVYHATGKRIRKLPIRIEDLL